MKKTTKKILQTYNKKATSLSDQYQSVETEDVLSGLKSRLPRLKALDIACGNGRDAKWLAGQGFEVVAADGSEGMIREAIEANSHPNVSYLTDLMPSLSNVRDRGEKYDAITMSAAWMHLDQGDRTRMFETMMDMVNPGAMIFISLRHGTAPEDRPMFVVGAEEIQEMATRNLLNFEHLTDGHGDKLGRNDVWWDSVCLRVPANHDEALPVYRDSIIKAPKNTSYKLGLAYCLTDMISTQPESVDEIDDIRVSVPMGPLMLKWAGLYDGLSEEGVYQIRPSKRIKDPLEATRRFAQSFNVASLENLKDNAVLEGNDAVAFQKMMHSIQRSIVVDGPARFITRRDSKAPVFQYVGADNKGAALDRIEISDELLKNRFGSLVMARDIAEAAQEYAPLIQAGITREWVDFSSRATNMKEDKVQSALDRVLKIA